MDYAAVYYRKWAVCVCVCCRQTKTSAYVVHHIPQQVFNTHTHIIELLLTGALRHRHSQTQSLEWHQIYQISIRDSEPKWEKKKNKIWRDGVRGSDREEIVSLFFSSGAATWSESIIQEILTIKHPLWLQTACREIKMRDSGRVGTILQI